MTAAEVAASLRETSPHLESIIDTRVVDIAAGWLEERSALIAAAPAALDLLKHFVTGWELMPEHLVLQHLGVGWPRTLRMAKAVIEKSEGGI